jgi:hypothetical protein
VGKEQLAVGSRQLAKKDTNQPISQLTNQPINQKQVGSWQSAVGKKRHQSANQPINQLTN